MSKVEGFAAVPNWMIRDKRVPRNAILVYASLSSRAGMGAIFPSQVTIADECGLSDRTVRKMLANLEELGLIERHSRRGKEGRSTSKTDGYTLHPNGRTEGTENISGRSKGPEANTQGTGNNEQCVPLIEVDKEEVDKDSAQAVSFDDFWAVWPRKESKKSALAAWGRAVKKAAPEAILAAAAAFASSPFRPEARFVPYGASWLNAERWNDPLPQPSASSSSALDRAAEAHALLTADELLAVSS